MEAVGTYLIGVTAAALLCGLVTRLGSGKLTAAVLRTACGMFMALAVVNPLLKLEFRVPSNLLQLQEEGEQWAALGENSGREEMSHIITGQLRTYILDKAGSLGLELEVEIELSQEELPVPVAVTLRGDVSPYNKELLGDYMQKELGIGKEAQKWIT